MTITWIKVFSPVALAMLIGMAGAAPARAAVDYTDLLTEMPTVTVAHEAFALLPAELIAAPTVVKARPSPDLRYILVVRQETKMTPPMLQAVAGIVALPPFTDTTLILWDSMSHESREVWRLSGSDRTIKRVEWMPGSAAALVLIQPALRMEGAGSAQKSAVLRVDAASAKAELLAAGSDSTEDLSWYMSRTQPLAVLERDESTPVTGGLETAETLTGVGAAGPLGPPAALPSGMDARPQWAEDGSLVLSTITRAPGVPDVAATYTLDLPSGKLRSRKPLDKPAVQTITTHSAAHLTAAGLASMLPVTLQTTNAQVNDGQPAGNVNMLWLQAAGVKPMSRALVGLDATDAYILPDAQGIVYTMKGAVWVTPVVRMNPEQYARVQRVSQIRRTSNNAKQLGLALLQWVQDNDEKYPSPDDLKAKLMPYLAVEDKGIIDNFVYTYPGGDMAAIEAPAETILGYIPGPGGQAILYADGHVRWQNQ